MCARVPCVERAWEGGSHMFTRSSVEHQSQNRSASSKINSEGFEKFTLIREKRKAACMSVFQVKLCAVFKLHLAAEEPRLL